MNDVVNRRGVRLAGFGMLIVGTTISIVSAVISVKGMGVLFSGAAATVMVLMTALEVGKLAAATASHLYGAYLAGPIRAYLGITTVILCGITSIGVFSLLANAWEVRQGTAAQIRMQREMLQTDITRLNERRAEAKEQLSQLDESLAVFIKFERATQAEAARADQAETRERLSRALASYDERLDMQFQDLSALEQSEAILAAKSGAITHLANISGLSADQSATVFAVIIVTAADPLAILLLLTGLSLLSTREETTRLSAIDAQTTHANQTVDDTCIPKPDGTSCQQAETESFPTEEPQKEGADLNTVLPAAEGKKSVRAIPIACSDDMIVTTLLENLGEHENVIERDGDRLLRAPTSTIKTLLDAMAPHLADEVSRFVERIDADGLPARRFTVNGKQLRAIRLKTLNKSQTCELPQH